MQFFTAGVANIVYADMVAKINGDAITVGTVTGYLEALSGVNANKYYRASDGTWQALASSAGDMTLDRKSRWKLSIAAGAWIAGVRYVFSADESGDLNVPYSDDVVEQNIESNVTVDAVVAT